jgi:hypothetical protein
MANLLLGYPNRADDVCVLAGGSWVDSLPLTNLQDRRIAKRARSSNTNLTSTQFTITLDKSRALNVIALVGHNLTTDARFRIRGNSSNNCTSPDYDSGWKDVWQDLATSTLGTLEWESDGFWSWKIDPEEAKYYPGMALCVFDYTRTNQYWIVEIDDETNSDGYVEIGRLFVSTSWEVSNNVSYGWNIAYEDNSIIETSLSGAEYFDKRPLNRAVTLSLDWLSETEGLTTAWGVSRILGVTGEVLFVWDKDDSDNLMRRSFIGRLKQLDPIENPDPIRFKTAFEIKEVIG